MRPRHHDVISKYTLPQMLVVLEIPDDEYASTVNVTDDFDERTRLFHELVKTARKRALRKYHPDVCKDTGALERAQEINQVAEAMLHLRLIPLRRRAPKRVLFRSGSIDFSFGGINIGGCSGMRVDPGTGSTGTARIYFTMGADGIWRRDD